MKRKSISSFLLFLVIILVVRNEVTIAPMTVVAIEEEITSEPETTEEVKVVEEEVQEEITSELVPVDVPEIKLTQEDIDTDVDFSAYEGTDVFAVLYVPAVDILLPIAQGEDNEYYLRHDFLGNRDINGTLFLECHANKDFHDAQTLMFGHNMKSGAVLAPLKKAPEDIFANPVFYVITEEEVIEYDIFAYRFTNIEDAAFAYGYQHDSVFESFLESSIAASEYDFGVTVSADDEVFTIATCSGNGKDGRLLVQGKRACY